MNPQEIDCIDMKEKVQRQIYEEIKDLSKEEQLAYFRRAVSDDSPLARRFRRAHTGLEATPPGDPNQALTG